MIRNHIFNNINKYQNTNKTKITTELTMPLLIAQIDCNLYEAIVRPIAIISFPLHIIRKINPFTSAQVMDHVEIHQTMKITKKKRGDRQVNWSKIYAYRFHD